VLDKGKDLGGIFETVMQAVAFPFKAEEGDTPNPAAKVELARGTRRRNSNRGKGGKGSSGQPVEQD
jgi:hypothetical protein